MRWHRGIGPSGALGGVVRTKVRQEVQNALRGMVDGVSCYTYRANSPHLPQRFVCLRLPLVASGPQAVDAPRREVDCSLQSPRSVRLAKIRVLSCASVFRSTPSRTGSCRRRLGTITRCSASLVKQRVKGSGSGPSKTEMS